MRRLRIVGSALMSFAAVTSLTGCLGKRITFREGSVVYSGVTDYLLYYVVGSRDSETNRIKDGAYVLVYGFTGLGEKQERLDIPRTIDGYPVKQMGRAQLAWSPEDNDPIYFPSTLKKLFVFETLEKIENGHDGRNVNLMVCSEEFYGDRIDEYTNIPFIYKSLYDSEYSYLPGEMTPDGKIYNPHCSPANITFMNNYPLEDDGGHYRLDNIGSEECIIEPPAPELEGYEFNGWYTDKECKDRWDFSTSLTLKMGDEFVLYAGWKTASGS